MKTIQTLALVLGAAWTGCTGGAAAPPSPRAAGEAALVPARLRCEYRTDPLGIGEAHPRLEWILEPAGPQPRRGLRQSAWQVLVASDPSILEEDRGDLWDSGKVASDRSSQIVYGGRPLASRQACWWKVRVWDQDGRPSRWSAPARWTMGLLQPADWQAQWIGYDEKAQTGAWAPEDAALVRLQGLKWAGLGTKGTASGGPRVLCLRRSFDLPDGRRIRRAAFVLTADDEADLFVNGRPAGHASRWESAALLETAPLLRPGRNVLAVVATQSDGYPPQALGRLAILFEEGDPLVLPLDKSWKASADRKEGWEGPDFGDEDWPAAKESTGPNWGTATLADKPLPPPPLLRKPFRVEKPVRRATLYATALGLYRLSLNGERVGRDEFTPGWTDYQKRVHYQTYDVTNQVRQGENVLGALLGDGWYAGCIAFTGQRQWYGGFPRLKAQLEIEHPDGARRIVATDGTWKAAYGPVLHADLLMGCAYDARRERPGWDRPGFDDASWNPVATGLRFLPGPVRDVTAKVAAEVRPNGLDLEVSRGKLGIPNFSRPQVLTVEYRAGGETRKAVALEGGRLEIPAPAGGKLEIVRAVLENQFEGAEPRLEACPSEPVRRFEELPARTVREVRPGVFLFDLGQNLVGWVRLRAKGEPGRRIRLRHGERLNPDGTLYASNLRSASSTDFYFPRGRDEEVFEPVFTFHGFQYVEVTGLRERPEPSDVTGIVVHSDMPRTGTFECSHPLVNQLYRNIVWGQKGNYLEVPTDCPQRDERAGWTGDTQFFIPTAAYNFDVAAFFTDWLVTMCQDSQDGGGAFAHVAPSLGLGGGSTAWGDAALICTHRIWQVYGDTRIIERHWTAMERYMDWLDRRTRDGIASVGGFGDWLNLGGGAKKEVMDTAYAAHLARLMAEMASAIGRREDAARYRERHRIVKDAFREAFLLPDGRIKDSSQTGFALAFTMDLLPDELKPKAAEQFVEEVRKRDWHLATGFIGTPRLLPALHAAGRADAAYRLLLQDTYPSWLFQVKLGATTMWERWDGWTPEKGFQTIGMNSFNHYAFGAVGQFLYETVAGIGLEEPGFRRILIRPVPGGGLTWARATYDSAVGRIASSWRLEGERFRLEVTIPPNAAASVHVPAANAAAVTEGGVPAEKAPGVKFLRPEAGAAVYEVGSGTYVFESRLP